MRPEFSSLYRTAPQLDVDQEPFWNAAVKGEWDGTPESLLERLLMWESAQGRRRDPKRPKGPRVIDLDLLLFGIETRVSSRLTIPHHGLASRAFALVPLLELLPESADSRGVAWKTVLANLSDQGVDPVSRTW